MSELDDTNPTRSPTTDEGEDATVNEGQTPPTEEDERRRVMTPPEEWGDSGEVSHTLLDADTGWLSEDEAETGTALSDGDVKPAAPAESPLPAGPAGTEFSTINRAATGNGDGIGSLESDWLTDATTRLESESTDTAPEASADWLATEPLDAPTMGGPDDRDTGRVESTRSGDSSATDGDDWLDDAASASSEATQPLSEPDPRPSSASDDDHWVTAENASELTAAEVSAGSEPQSAEAILTDHQMADLGPKGKPPLWPAVAIATALVLLVIGGWGAISERSKLTARIGELETALAQRSRQGDLTSADEQSLRDDNQSLRLQLASLREQYAALGRQVDELQERADTETRERLAAAAKPAAGDDVVNKTPGGDSQKAAATAVTTATPAESTNPQNTPESERAQPKASKGGRWFVNVAAYSQRSLANDWLAKIEQDAEQVVLSSVVVNGKTLYRVRVVGMDSKDAAKALASALEQKYRLGPLWVGEDAEAPAAATPRASSPAAPKVSSSPAPTVPVDRVTATPEPIELPASNQGGGWFIYVDTYSQGADADNKALVINEAGYDAKVAVEYRAGELFYRVQVVGIGSQAEGERIAEELAALGGMPNLQLRQY